MQNILEREGGREREREREKKAEEIESNRYEIFMQGSPVGGSDADSCTSDLTKLDEKVNLVE